MRNIFLYIRRYFTLLAFLLLQGFALWMVFRFNQFHHAAFLGVANEVTGSVNRQMDKLDDYVHQGEENKRVHRMNDSLLNQQSRNFIFPDSNQTLVVDSLNADTLRGYRRYYYRDAKVVYNNTGTEHNFLQIDRGSKLGIRDNMAVLSSDGSVVGQIVNVSPNFSAVMSLLHVKNSVSAALKKTGDGGKVRWDGKDPRYVTLEDISKSVTVKVGDTVLTSKFSFNFPPDKMIGTIASIDSDPATGFYILKVKTAVNFSNVQQVFVVENLQRDEQLQLDAETERKVEQQKPGGRN